MALAGCNARVKYTVITVNLLFGLCGIGILVVGLMVRLREPPQQLGKEEQVSYDIGVRILLAFGGIVTVLSFCGCFGAYRESQHVLGAFFTLLIVVLIVEGVFLMVAFDKNMLHKKLEERVWRIVQEKYGLYRIETEALDTIQTDLGCCGAYSYKDWSTSRFVEMQDSKSEKGFVQVPDSCCKSHPFDKCNTEVPLDAKKNHAIHTRGCLDKMKQDLNHKLDVFIGVAVGIAFIQVLDMFLSLFLCCMVREKPGVVIKASAVPVPPPPYSATAPSYYSGHYPTTVAYPETHPVTYPSLGSRQARYLPSYSAPYNHPPSAY